MESMEYIAFQSYAYVNFPVKKYFCSTTNFLTYVLEYSGLSNSGLFGKNEM